MVLSAYTKQSKFTQLTQVAKSGEATVQWDEESSWEAVGGDRSESAEQGNEECLN
jgi:hypothetical protein